MTFSSPVWLLALAAVPLAALAYAASQRRGRRFAVRFPAAPTLLLAAGATPPWRRHLPAALALTAFAALALAMAKPQHTVRVPIEKASIVLVTDHSGSMQATDVDPNRLIAAQSAATTFIDKVPKAVRIGAVAFAQSPDAVQAPSTDHTAAKQVIDSQQAIGATATGDALAVALDLIKQVNAGRKAPSAVILLSDGARTTGRDPVEVAQEARAAGIPVYTVALGSPGATIPNPTGFGPPVSVEPDYETLREVASITRATAFDAPSEKQLSSIYERLGSRLGSRATEREISAWFAIGGLVLLLGAAGLSARSAGRLP